MNNDISNFDRGSIEKAGFSREKYNLNNRSECYTYRNAARSIPDLPCQRDIVHLTGCYLQRKKLVLGNAFHIKNTITKFY